MNFVDIGGGNLISTERIISIVSPDSAPIKRSIQEARNVSLLIDATTGRATKSVIFCDSGHIVLSYNSAEVLQKKLGVNNG